MNTGFSIKEAMHLPDGFLSLGVSIVAWIVTIVYLFFAVRKTRENLQDRQIPMMGIMAAFIFAAQMINFPVLGGTSGHFLGGALAAIVLGPWAGGLVMASVVIVQALLFQDGGLIVMGANILNMGLITAVIGYGLYRMVTANSKGIRYLTIGIAAWLSVMAAAFFTSFQIWVSGVIPAGLVFPAMLGVHAVIGLGEALITVAAIAFIERVRPDIFNQEKVEQQAGTGWIIGGIIVTGIVLLISPFASADPDGLEKVADQLGFLNLGMDAPYQIIPDYSLPILGETGFSTILAGLIGVILVSGIGLILGRTLSRKTE
ncbi:MAG: energy-coupling factor ABC transporter permease [Anaerolineales bacterium]|nr:energy-coupling factor ABC transporter permease [Anaerolineales bacterium]